MKVSMFGISRTVVTIIYVSYSILVSATVGAASVDRECKELELLFARGSSQDLGATDYLNFRENTDGAITYKTTISHDYYELGTETYGSKYPAVSVSSPFVALGAKLSGGGAFKYGDSVKDGINELSTYLFERSNRCPSTRYIIAGYSQGAQVAGEAMSNIALVKDKVVYVALFGDPKLHLPEGDGGKKSPACKDEWRSDYRISVPNCTTHKGSLGARNPYIPFGWDGKVGLWCNDNDYICGSSTNVFNIPGAGHMEYIARYPEAANIFLDKLRPFFPYSFSTPQPRSLLIYSLQPETPDSKPEDNCTKLVQTEPVDEKLDSEIVAEDEMNADETYPDEERTEEEGTSKDHQVIDSCDSSLTAVTTETEAEADIRQDIVQIQVLQHDVASTTIRQPFVANQNLDTDVTTPDIKSIEIIQLGTPSQVKVYWDKDSSNASYLGFAINGIPVGYVDKAQGVLIIRDILLDQDVQLTMFGISGAGNISTLDTTTTTLAAIDNTLLPALSEPEIDSITYLDSDLGNQPPNDIPAGEVDVPNPSSPPIAASATVPSTQVAVAQQQSSHTVHSPEVKLFNDNPIPESTASIPSKYSSDVAQDLPVQNPSTALIILSIMVTCIISVSAVLYIVKRT